MFSSVNFMNNSEQILWAPLILALCRYHLGCLQFYFSPKFKAWEGYLIKPGNANYLCSFISDWSNFREHLNIPSIKTGLEPKVLQNTVCCIWYPLRYQDLLPKIALLWTHKMVTIMTMTIRMINVQFTRMSYSLRKIFTQKALLPQCVSNLR